MKNLFDYATKELSQDAFLRWLFENYDCEDKTVREACYYVLSKLCKTSFLDGDIVRLVTHAQWWKIDIIVEFETSNQKFALAIEDKTFSSEHSNQLKGYKDILDKYEEYNDRKRIYAFYKTDLKKHSDNDIKACLEAKWDYYFLEDIKEWFNNFVDYDCEILNDYIKHLFKLHEKLEITSNDIKTWDIINYNTFFENEVLNNDDLKKEKKILDLSRWGWYGTYASIGGKRIFVDEQLEISFEIVGRPYHRKFDVLIRFVSTVGDRESDGFKHRRDAVKSYLSKHLDNCNIKLKICNNKMCIASNARTNKNEIENNPLSYEKSVYELKNTMVELIKWFNKTFDKSAEEIFGSIN